MITYSNNIKFLSTDNIPEAEAYAATKRAILPINYFNLPEEYATIVDTDLEFLHHSLELVLPKPRIYPDLIMVKEENDDSLSHTDDEDLQFYLLDDPSSVALEVPTAIKIETNFNLNQNEDDDTLNFILLSSDDEDSEGKCHSQYEINVVKKELLDLNQPSTQDTKSVDSIPVQTEGSDISVNQVQSTGQSNIYALIAGPSQPHIDAVSIISKGDILSGNIPFEVNKN